MNEEQSLADRLATDLDGHFEQLVRAYQDRLYGFTLRLLRNAQEAEECTQDTFVRAYRALARYPAERRRELRLKAWLHQIALNVVRNRVRQPALMTVGISDELLGGARVFALESSSGLAADPAEQPETAALHAEGWSRLADALDDLPDRYRTAVVLRHVQGLSYAEAAAVLDQPVGTTKSDVYRGLRLLREALEGEGVALAQGRNG
jgi:RNA polymerase sigma-70 factor (ECF subfamily)